MEVIILGIALGTLFAVWTSNFLLVREINKVRDEMWELMNRDKR